MSAELTTSQVNKLGERLRRGQALPSDQEMLEAFRRSFDAVYQDILGTLAMHGMIPSGRIKTTLSIIQKLQRESIRLSRLQDIAGFRVVTAHVESQDRFAALLSKVFAKTKIIDRRQTPMHGYRAIHCVIELDGKLVEIQIRTELQHLWAGWSETLATALGQEIKYGGGPEPIRQRLMLESNAIAMIEDSESSAHASFRRLVEMGLPADIDVLVAKLSEELEFSGAREQAIVAFKLVVDARELRERLIREILAIGLRGIGQ